MMVSPQSGYDHTKWDCIEGFPEVKTTSSLPCLQSQPMSLQKAIGLVKPSFSLVNPQFVLSHHLDFYTPINDIYKDLSYNFYKVWSIL